MWYGKRPVRSKSVGPALAVLFLVNVLNFYDRQTLAAILEPLRHEFSLSDTQLGGLFTLFTVVFALATKCALLRATRLGVGTAWGASTSRAFRQLAATRPIAVAKPTCGTYLDGANDAGGQMPNT